MADGSKYDVFISYSRKDYVRDEQPFEGNVISKIMEMFDENGISYWIDKEGIRSGDKFMKEIAKAITDSTMMVFVSSLNSNQSEWTAGEVSTAKAKKKRIIPFLIDETEFSDDFIVALEHLDHVDYFHQPKTALSDLLRAVKKEKEKQLLILEEKKRDEEAQKKKKLIATEVMRFWNRNAALRKIVDTVIELHSEMGHVEKVCPVCHCSLPLGEPYCLKCGWYFHPLEQLCEEEDFLKRDDDAQIQYEERLALSRSLWEPKRSADSSKVIAELKQRIEVLEAHLEEKQTECDHLREDWLKLNDKLQKVSRVKKSEVEHLKIAAEDLQKRNMMLESTIQELNAQLEELKSKATPKLTRSSATLKLGRIVDKCKTSYNLVFSSDPISKIDLSQFSQLVLAEFGVAMTGKEMMKCKTIAKLKEAVLAKLSLAD